MCPTSITMFSTSITLQRICILLCTILLAAPLSARKRTFRMERFGIAPGEKELCTRLRHALEEIRQQTEPGDEVVLRFKKGEYAFHAADAAPCSLYVSNHDQDQPKRVAILLEGWRRLTVEGNGSRFVFHGRLMPLALRHSQECTLRNFSIDFANPQISQVEIVRNDGPAGITFRPAPWVRWRISPDSLLETYGEGWTARPVSGIAFEPATRHILYNTGDLPLSTKGVTATGDGTLHAPAWRDARLAPGTLVALRTWYRPAPAVFLEEDSSTSLEDIRVHYAEGMGLLAQRCTDISLKRFDVCLKGADDPRCFTTQADATHFSQCKGVISVTDGLFENMMDDAINVHGVYLRVTERTDARTLVCTFGHSQAWGFAWGNAGDTVRLVRSATMEPAGPAGIISAIRPLGSDSSHGARGYVVTLRDALPDSLFDGRTLGIENLTWTPEVVFAGNTIRNNRARGALFSSPRRTLCERNTFDHTSGSAILLCGDCNGWYESGAVHDLVIRRNRFINPLTSLYQFTEAAISICPEIPDLGRQQQYFHGGRPGAISITDNEFDMFDAPLLYAKSVDGLVFRNNVIRHNTAYAPFHPNRQAVRLDRTRRVDVSGTGSDGSTGAAARPAESSGGR